MFSNLSITEETWVDEMRIRSIKFVNLSILHFNPWVEASTCGLLVPKGLYSPVAKYFGTCFKNTNMTWTVKNKVNFVNLYQNEALYP
jgi:hypothetical protein